jgi:hypothetical protein
LLCLTSSYVLCAQYRQCMSLYYPFLIVPSVFSNVYSIYIYLFIIRDSKVVIVIIATFVQPGNRRRVWRNQSGNQKPYIEWETMQWPQKGQKDKQWCTKHYTENTEKIE